MKNELRTRKNKRFKILCLIKSLIPPMDDRVVYLTLTQSEIVGNI